MFHIRNSESQHFLTFASEIDFAIRFVEVLIMKKFLTALVLIIFATMPLFAQSRVVNNPVNKAFGEYAQEVILHALENLPTVMCSRKAVVWILVLYTMGLS